MTGDGLSFDVPGHEAAAAQLARVNDTLAMRTGQLLASRRFCDELRGELASAWQRLERAEKDAPTRVRCDPNVVHKLMHAEYDADGWRYVTGCGHALTGSDAVLTTGPATCEWCTA